MATAPEHKIENLTPQQVAMAIVRVAASRPSHEPNRFTRDVVSYYATNNRIFPFAAVINGYRMRQSQLRARGWVERNRWHTRPATNEEAEIMRDAIRHPFWGWTDPLELLAEQVESLDRNQAGHLLRAAVKSRIVCDEAAKVFDRCVSVGVKS